MRDNSHHPPTHGKACQPFDYSNITANDQHYCFLTCAARSDCHGIIFDASRFVCMQLKGTCLTLESYPRHVYQSFEDECAKWVPESGDYNVYGWLFGRRTNTNIVARTFRDGDIIVGKLTNKFFYISGNGTVVMGGSYERLVVDSGCDVTWDSYNSNSCLPLPPGALIGGVLTATNTPLYVARFRIAGEVYLFSGYFNPLNQLAWTEYLAAISSDLGPVSI